MTRSEPTFWEQTGGKVGANHPITSHTAAGNVKAGSQRAQALFAIAASPNGLTGYHASEYIFNGANRPISPNQACTRLGEMREAGIVEFKRDFPGGPIVDRETTPGNTGQVHVLTSEGREQVRLLKMAATLTLR